MDRVRKLLYFLLGAVVVGLTGFAVVDSWIEALALGPVLVLLAWLMARAWWLLDDLELLEQRYARLSELNRENLAQLELAQLRVDALGVAGRGGRGREARARDPEHRGDRQRALDDALRSRADGRRALELVMTADHEKS